MSLALAGPHQVVWVRCCKGAQNGFSIKNASPEKIQVECSLIVDKTGTTQKGKPTVKK